MQFAELFAKQIFAGLLYYTGLLSLWVRLKQRSAGPAHSIILAYHCFLEIGDPLRRFIQDGLCITPGNFERQLLFLKRHYRIISLDDLIDALAAGNQLPPRSVVITVDDGWRDNFTNAFPLLLKYEAPATIFLTVDYIDSAREFWFLAAGRVLDDERLTVEAASEALATVSGQPQDQVKVRIADGGGKLDRNQFIEEMKSLEYERQEQVLRKLASRATVGDTGAAMERCTLIWDEVRAMKKAGVGIGSHGVSHRILTLLSPQDVRTELEDSRRRIEAQLGTTIRHFSYPNGNFNGAVAEAVKQAGYQSAVTTGDGVRPADEHSDRYALKRIGMHDGVSAGVSGRFSKALLAFHLARFA